MDEILGPRAQAPGPGAGPPARARALGPGTGPRTPVRTRCAGKACPRTGSKGALGLKPIQNDYLEDEKGWTNDLEPMMISQCCELDSNQSNN